MGAKVKSASACLRCRRAELLQTGRLKMPEEGAEARQGRGPVLRDIALEFSADFFCMNAHNALRVSFQKIVISCQTGVPAVSLYAVLAEPSEGCQARDASGSGRASPPVQMDSHFSRILRYPV